MLRRIAIVGVSAAGLAAAETLRRHGYDGKLTLIGDEQPLLPYDRPPLSKQILAGTWKPEQARLRSNADLDRLDAEFIIGNAATALDPRSRRIQLDNGSSVGYDGLIIATGVAARTLPGNDLQGVHVLRTMDDALALRDDLLAGPRVIVVGAGFLGTEVASTARTMGLDVTLVEPAPIPVCALGPRIGGFVAELHRSRGTQLCCGVGIRQLHGAGGRVTGVELADGTMLPADVVVLAIGAVPATDWLVDSGLPLGNGIECDRYCQAAPGIFAAGDVASWFHPRAGRRIRLEHRMNATEQAIAAASNLLGEKKPFAPVPYFWTNQYDIRIQAFGLFPANSEIRLLRGDPADQRFVLAYGHQGVVTGLLGWNAARELRELQPLVAERTAWTDCTDRSAVTL